MTKSHKIPGGKGQAASGQAASGQAASGKAREAKPPAGGVLHDDRGNAVWHWASDTARNAAMSTSALLKRLNVSSLSLEETLDEERRQAAAWVSHSAAAAPVKPSAVNANAKVTGVSRHKPRARSWWRRLFQRG